MTSVSYSSSSPESVVTQRSSDLTAPLNEEDLVLAGTLVEDALRGRFLRFKKDAQFVRSYRLYYHWSLCWIQHIAVAALILLAIFERPAVVETELWVTITVEAIILLYFTFRLTHTAHFQHKVDFWKDSKNVVAGLVIVLTIVDVIAYCIWVSLAPDTNPVRWSRPLRPLFIVNFPQGRQVRTAFRNIRRSLREIVYVLILLLCSILLFALLALKLFGKKRLTYADGRPYFSSYWDCLWDLYVLVTTANNPDVMMPAYDVNNWYALFFVIYLVLNLYIFMHILLAVIFNSYKKQLKNEVKDSVYAKRRKLAQAFDVMRINVGIKDGSAKYVLPQQHWQQLITFLDPRRSAEQIDILLRVLDGDGNGQLVKKEFLQMAEVLEVKLTEVQDRLTLFERCCPNVYLSTCSYGVRSAVQHKYFRYFFDLVIAVNAVFIAIEQFAEIEWFFLGLFTFEIILKVYSYGFQRFLSAYWNIFDVVILLAALISMIIESASGIGASRDVVDIVLVIRCLRLVRLVNGIHKFKIIITTIVNIGPSIFTYGGVLFVFYYVFAIVGMEAFGGRVRYYGYNESALTANEMYCGSSLLKGSDFYRSRYCNNNFNDILKALTLLFELTVVNQWHILATGFALVTHEAAKIYFLLFHLSCVVLIVNIFVAFILEAFMLEYSLSRGKYESAVELKIKELGYALGQSQSDPANLRKVALDKTALVDFAENPEDSRVVIGTAVVTVAASPGSVSLSASSAGILEILPREEGIRFHLKAKVFKKVGTLLQQMFESEIDPEDMGPDTSLDSTDDALSAVKMTLDAI